LNLDSVNLSNKLLISSLLGFFALVLSAVPVILLVSPPVFNLQPEQMH
jgi:hypothetical protein